MREVYVSMETKYQIYLIQTNLLDVLHVVMTRVRDAKCAGMPFECATSHMDEESDALACNSAHPLWLVVFLSCICPLLLQ